MAKLPAVLTHTLPCRHGQQIGVLTLNAPKAMNAVDLTMVDLIDEALEHWATDDTVVAVVMRGAGERAFCAGGDIRKLHRSMLAKGKRQYQYADAFFASEYRKNYRVHQFNKPLIAWGQGFVMGGGLGLFIAANHRIATPSIHLAWPEVRIGLFPDVAASYYLSRLPYPLGHWLGLTGSAMNATDCKAFGFTQYVCAEEGWETLLAGLVEQPWQANRAENHALVRRLIRSQELPNDLCPDSRVEPIWDDLNTVFAENDLVAIDRALRTHSNESHWWKTGVQQYLKGCPATAALIMVQLERGQRMSLKEVVQWELILAWQAVRHPDFTEGIRALVLDKDGQPNWQHAHVSTVTESWLVELQRSPWTTQNHPFLDL
ncbi:MAG: enoyl-CoA hydratase/isomerase family protein [Bacterioplanes sp.]|nr:enoyl-CoA hydratase/isomerase family protein [Bacterioplanes sp.]